MNDNQVKYCVLNLSGYVKRTLYDKDKQI
jgi:hypothetical protein